MNNHQYLKKRIDQSFTLTHDLVSHLDESCLGLGLPGLPANRMGDQLWCMVGARESYLKAIKMRGWQGFSCSLDVPLVKPAVLAALEASHQQLNEIDFTSLSEAQVDLAFDLLEHEVQHHGQLIRFVYGNRLIFPDSWNQRYNV